MAQDDVVRYETYSAMVWTVPEEWWSKIRKGQLSKKKGDRLVDLGERAIAIRKGKPLGAGGERNVFEMRMGKETLRAWRPLHFAPPGEEVKFTKLMARPDLNGEIGNVLGMKKDSDRLVVSDPVKGGKYTVAVQAHNLLTRSPIEWNATRWVAKENKNIESSNEKEAEFHEKSIVTQATASALAEEFNEHVKSLKLTTALPEVHYLKRCYYMTAMQPGVNLTGQHRFFFVEEQLNGEYRKVRPRGS